MTRPRVALRVPVGRPLPELAAFAARCEQAGFDGVGIHDHPSSGRDAYLALAMAARATHRLQLFPATSSPLVRHPLVLASLAHSLEEIAPGRTYLTVAPGFISTRSVGKPRATVAFMRAAIRDLRRLLAGEDVEFGPTSTRLRNRSATPTPVYLLAAGPRMIELAGEMADGVFLMVGLHSAAVGAALRHLEEGARRAGRSWPASRWFSWSRSVSDPMPRWGRDGCGAGSLQVSPSSPIRAPRIFAGSGPPASNSRTRTIPPPSPRIRRAELQMHLDCSARRNVVQSDSCRRGRTQGLSMCSCSRRMTSRAATTCRRPRSRLSPK